MTKCLLSQVILILMIVVTIPAGAQSRLEEISRRQAEKAKHLVPFKPNKAEEIVLKVQNWGLISPPRGLYPFFGSAYSGGGLAVGVGYLKSYGDSGVFDVHGAWSVYNYKLLQAGVKLPDLGDGKVKTVIVAKYQNANKVSFFGIGNDSLEENKANFSYEPLSVSFTERANLSGWSYVGGKLEYLDISTGPGASGSLPSIEEAFSPSEVPGLGLDPTYTVGNLFAAIDWRQFPGYTTRGGFYRVDWYDYNAKDDPFDFHRFDVELDQFLPIFRANQIIALRALASFTDINDLNDVPYFLLPKLGGGEELRGFSDFRFRDRHRMLLTVEYRWTPSKFLDMALFYETGKVASKAADLDFNDLHDCYGLGVRFHTAAFTALRIELAHSNEATRLIFSAGASF